MFQWPQNLVVVGGETGCEMLRYVVKLVAVAALSAVGNTIFCYEILETRSIGLAVVRNDKKACVFNAKLQLSPS